LLARQVDGIIWAVPEVGENRNWLASQLPELIVPTIFLAMSPREDISIVYVDNYYGGRLAVEHLIEIGRKNIAHVSGPLSWFDARQRKQAWEDVLTESGFSIEDRFWYEGTWGPSSGERGILELLKKFPEMDAVFVGNDQMALSVMQVACREGIRIPEEIAVVGYDGIRETEFYWPPLTTVYQDLYKLGCLAVEELVQMVEKKQSNHEDVKTKPSHMKIIPELIIRESTVKS
jgi:LacI family transcriptional regulator